MTTSSTELILNHQTVSLSMDTVQIFNKITSTWNKAAEYMIEVALTLHQLQSDNSNKKLWSEVRDTLIDRKIMSRTIISNLCKVGENRLLTENVNLLPPAYNTMWELTKLSEEDLGGKFRDGLINPELKLEQVRQWSSLPITDVDFEIHEEETVLNENKRSITISFKEEDIVNNYEVIEEHLKSIQFMMSYADIQVSGLLKRKISGD